MRSYLDNDSTTLNDPEELYTFMIGVNHCFKFSRKSHKELQSKDKNKRQKYTQGQILNTLIIFENEIFKNQYQGPSPLQSKVSHLKELELDHPPTDIEVS